MKIHNTLDITLQDIKECPEFSHLTDEQLQFVYDQFSSVCKVLVSQRHKLLPPDQQHKAAA